MSRAQVPVLAVVVVTRAGRSLARALDSVAWASERAVLDPAGEVGAEIVPAGVRLAPGTRPRCRRSARRRGCSSSRSTRWRPRAWTRTSRASRGRALPECCRVGVAVDTLGVRLVPRYAAVRLAPRDTARVVVERGLELGLAGGSAHGSAPGGWPVRLPRRVDRGGGRRARHGESLRCPLLAGAAGPCARRGGHQPVRDGGGRCGSSWRTHPHAAASRAGWPWSSRATASSSRMRAHGSGARRSPSALREIA